MQVFIDLNSPIFNDVARRQAVSGFPRQQSRDFKNLTKRRIIESRAGGRLYKRKGGLGFTRSHRASASGQRPAIDTGTLLNAISDRRISEMSAEAYIAPASNPKGGTSADVYAGYLQDNLDRPIMSESDAAEAQVKANRDAVSLVLTLC